MIKVFVDFDGTISSVDVGGEILRKFASPLWFYWNELWKSGEIGSFIALRRQFSEVKVGFSSIKEEILDFVEPTPGAVDFFLWLHENAVPVAVVSDGQDFYINYLLKKWGISKLVPELEVFSNVSRFMPRGIEIEFPYFNPSCPVCGNCKLSHLQRASDKGLTTIYIGDGLSDYCPAVRGADVVFAKAGRDLYRRFREEGRSFFPFEDFYEVASILQRLFPQIFKIPLKGGDEDVVQALQKDG